MLGSRSGFQMLVKDKSPEVTGIHCVIHRQTLACKTMPPQLLEMLYDKKIVNSFSALKCGFSELT